MNVLNFEHDFQHFLFIYNSVYTDPVSLIFHHSSLSSRIEGSCLFKLFQPSGLQPQKKVNTIALNKHGVSRALEAFLNVCIYLYIFHGGIM